jgi:hypothetical protein
MTERRLVSSQEELARSLIASARLDDKPVPDAVRHGMLAALGAAGAVGSASVVAGAASGALHRLVLVKWLVGAVIVGTAGIGAYAVVKQGQSSQTSHANAGAAEVGRGAKPSVTLSPPTLHDASVTPAQADAEAQHDDASPAEPRAQHRAAAGSAASADKLNAADASSLEGEVTALDRARSALAAGDATRALELLGQYEQAFPKGALRPEATYLRIQALSKSGQREAARELAARFLAKHPSTPHAAQLQALLSR